MEQLDDGDSPHIQAASERNDAGPLTQFDRTTRSKATDLGAIPWIPRWFFELTGYGLASAMALIADTLILRCLVVNAGWNYLPASIASFICGAAVAYLLSIRFVFKHRRTVNHATEFSYFLVLGVVGLLVNTIVLWLTVGLANRNLITSKLFAAICTFSTNFVLRRWLLFSPSEQESTR